MASLTSQTVSCSLKWSPLLQLHPGQGPRAKVSLFPLPEIRPHLPQTAVLSSDCQEGLEALGAQVPANTEWVRLLSAHWSLTLTRYSLVPRSQNKLGNPNWATV